MPRTAKFCRGRPRAVHQGFRDTQSYSAVTRILKVCKWPVNILRAPGASDWYENNRSMLTLGLQDYIDVMLPKGERTTFDEFNIPERGET